MRSFEKLVKLGFDMIASRNDTLADVVKPEEIGVDVVLFCRECDTAGSG